jgi:glycosyltransferase involved in cell wall biosynthesis
MRVLFATYLWAFQCPGGGEVQLLKTREALEAIGPRVDLFDPWTTKVRDYDVLHFFSSKSEGLRLCRSARTQGRKVVVSPIFWRAPRSLDLPPNWDWGGYPRWHRFLSAGAEWLWRRALVREADRVLPNSLAEAKHLEHWFGVREDRIRVVHNGVDPSFEGATREAFVERFGLGGFILVVGNLHPRKNQLGLLRALKTEKDLPPLVFIGSGDAAPDYAAECRREAWKGVRFLDPLPHDSPLLASAYAAAAVFVLPSLYETPGLAALEAGLAGAKVAVTTGGCTREYFGEDADYFDPRSASGIRDALGRALARPPSDALRSRIRGRFLWEHVARETLDVYRECVNGGS